MREGLKQAIRAIPRSQYPYFITACPDGEGAWFQETVNRSPEGARQLKDDYKKAIGGFSPEFVERIANSIRDCLLPLTLADIGGIPDEKIRKSASTPHTPSFYSMTAAGLMSGVGSATSSI